MQFPTTQYVSGRGEKGGGQTFSNYINTQTITGLILLLIAVFLITLPEIQESAKSLLLVVFTCVAMLQGI